MTNLIAIIFFNRSNLCVRHKQIFLVFIKLKMEKKKIVKEKLIVKFKNESYDLTNFLFKHPGGVGTLAHNNDKNIEKVFYESDHSKAAEHLLNEYKIPSVDDAESIEVKFNYLVKFYDKILVY